MAQITNAQLNQKLDDLKLLFEGRMEKVEKRVDIIEQQTLPVLNRVDGFFDLLKTFMKFMRWFGGIVVVTVVGQAIIWFFTHVVGH